MCSTAVVPPYLYHYYEAGIGPFVGLSDQTLAKAEQLLARIREEGVVFASKRGEDYLLIRRQLEDRVRELFIQKGGEPRRTRPHYMTLGACPWLLGWFREGREISVAIEVFDPKTVSFTYGDTFPAMRYGDGKPYRGQVFTLEELPELVGRYGLPQEWNPQGKLGPDRYIEAQIWADKSLRDHFKSATGTVLNGE